MTRRNVGIIALVIALTSAFAMRVLYLIMNESKYGMGELYSMACIGSLAVICFVALVYSAINQDS